MGADAVAIGGIERRGTALPAARAERVQTGRVSQGAVQAVGHAPLPTAPSARRAGGLRPALSPAKPPLIHPPTMAGVARVRAALRAAFGVANDAATASEETRLTTLQVGSRVFEDVEPGMRTQLWLSVLRRRDGGMAPPGAAPCGEAAARLYRHYLEMARE